ncbi:hypothetical protein TNCT_329441 [Trichonephila clavata]|uniref:Uncharacterized protein n=1 Tax=Trichonephila clavata TaxID=2740835 RepID=A0A8X6HEJ9_TRICU|nr:hypothetical protein TNCT_329441 [Trichonephila clavata]
MLASVKTEKFSDTPLPPTGLNQIFKSKTFQGWQSHFRGFPIRQTGKGVNMSNAAACVRRRETLLLIGSHCFLCSMFPRMFFLLCNRVRPREHIWIFKEMIHQGT